MMLVYYKAKKVETIHTIIIIIIIKYTKFPFIMQKVFKV